MRYVVADVVTLMIYVHLIPSSEVRKGRGFVAYSVCVSRRHGSIIFKG